VIDCSDLARSARFWADVLGYAAGPATSAPYRSLIPGNGQGIEVLMQRTGDDKHQKNRPHLDLHTAELDRQVGRILGLGASRLTDHPVTRTRMALAHPR
jgi:hypothetical protein